MVIELEQEGEAVLAGGIPVKEIASSPSLSVAPLFSWQVTISWVKSSIFTIFPGIPRGQESLDDQSIFAVHPTNVIS